MDLEKITYGTKICIKGEFFKYAFFVVINTRLTGHWAENADRAEREYALIDEDLRIPFWISEQDIEKILE